MQNIDSINQILEKYDTFLLDQWGVLHNGGNAFDGAISILQTLKAHNKKVVILSNSGRTRDFSYGRLAESGITRDLYHDVMTSGDHMRHNFASGKFEKLGKKALFFHWDYDYTVLDDCNVEAVDTVENATFILCCGVERGTIEAYKSDLEKALEKGLEMVLSNPDLVAMNPDGSLKTCPGSIAKAYEEMGGTVHWHGKPHAPMYTLCDALVGGWTSAVAVGDSLEHDVAGGNFAGISSVFITSGIHSGDIDMENRDNAEQDITALSKMYNATPTYILEWFC